MLNDVQNQARFRREVLDYGALIPPSIRLPAVVNLDFVRWRWENYNGV